MPDDDSSSRLHALLKSLEISTYPQSTDLHEAILQLARLVGAMIELVSQIDTRIAAATQLLECVEADLATYCLLRGISGKPGTN